MWKKKMKMKMKMKMKIRHGMETRIYGAQGVLRQLDSDTILFIP